MLSKQCFADGEFVIEIFSKNIYNIYKKRTLFVYTFHIKLTFKVFFDVRSQRRVSFTKDNQQDQDNNCKLILRADKFIF